MKKPKPKRPPEILRAAAATYAERNKVYKDNIFRVGKALHAMFPDGLVVKTQSDWHRIHLLTMMTVKMSRYAVNFTKGGHKDSIHDAIVYGAILEWIGEFDQ